MTRLTRAESQVRTPQDRELLRVLAGSIVAGAR
jgi:hypothetical protein